MTETLIPYIRDMAVRESIERIRDAKAKGPESAIGSTSEHIMYALALCEREFLPNNYRNGDPQDWWNRLNGTQRSCTGGRSSSRVANKETPAAGCKPGLYRVAVGSGASAF
jgi:hypothetical protein